MHGSGLLAEDNSPPPIRFGAFEVHVGARQLRKHGVKVKLRGQPFQILLLLLERPGEVVTREEMQEKLWPADTFVDFEHSLNTAIKKLRQALGDSAEEPRYIETLPRLGYRFIGTVAEGPAAEVTLEAAGPQLVVFSSAAARGQNATPSRAVASFLSWFSYWPWKWALAAAAAASLVTLAAISVLHVRGRPPRPTKIMLAVLPFENLTGDPNQDYFSDGLTEEMITDLGGLEPSRLGVIARTSVMQYKHSDKPVDQIGRELGLQYVLEGGVRRQGDHVRISAQLIRVKDQSHLWAQEYDRTPGDILGVESEVAQAVARSIQLNLTPQRQSRVARPVQVDPEVHELYLKGRYLWNKRTHGGLKQSIAYFEQAIAQDPSFAAAYAGLADSYLLLGGYGFEAQKITMSRARAAALKALAIDDRLAEAYTTLGLIAEQYDWNWTESEKDYRRAIELDPNYSVAHHWYGDGYLAAVGKTDEAIAELRKAHELDPLSLVIATDLAKRLCFAGNYDEGMEQFRKIFEIDPNFVQAHYWLSQAYELKRAYPEAIAEAKKIKPPDTIPYTIGQLGHIYALQGRRREALGIVDQLERLSKGTYVDPRYMANIYIALGEKDLAFGWLERAFEQHSPAMCGLKTDPVYYGPIRSDPRFQALMHRVGLAP